MREKTICLLLAGVLALSLAACAPAGTGPDPAPSPSASSSVEPSGPVLATPPPEGPSQTPSDEPSLSTPPPSAEYDLPHRDYQPWQVGYMDFLSRLQEADTNHAWEQGAYEGLAVDDRGIAWEWSVHEGPPAPLAQVMGEGSENYSLHDVDKDGVPELFVAYGFNGYITQCYTYRDGEIVCIGEFASKDSSLYTHPRESAVLRHGGRMGHYGLYEYPMEDGRLTEEREIFFEGPVDTWTEPDEIIPGAGRIDYFYTQLGEYDLYKGYAPESEWFGFDDGRPHPSAGKALVLPVCDWGVGPAETEDSSETARTAILAALNGEREVYGASGDHFYGDVGRTTWEEYIQPGGACPYNDQLLEVTHHAWLDMNGDGQEELLLWVVTMRGEDDGRPWTLEDTVVLSEQEGTVYAYFFGFFDGTDAFWDDGTVVQYDGNYRLSFWKNQCYQYIAPRSPSAAPVRWLDGSPVG